MATKSLANTETPAQMPKVSKRLGHASITRTEKIYSHCLPEFQKDSAKTADSFFEQISGDKPTRLAKKLVFAYKTIIK